MSSTTCPTQKFLGNFLLFLPFHLHILLSEKVVSIRGDKSHCPFVQSTKFEQVRLLYNLRLLTIAVLSSRFNTLLWFSRISDSSQIGISSTRFSILADTITTTSVVEPLVFALTTLLSKVCIQSIMTIFPQIRGVFLTHMTSEKGRDSGVRAVVKGEMNS